MKRKKSQKLKRIVSVLLSLTMLANMSAALPANAEEGIKHSSNHYSLVEANDAFNSKGDVNGDGKITDDDTTLLNKWLVRLVGDNEIVLENADVNLDGKVDIQDLVELSRFCQSTQIADGEGDYKNAYTPEPRARVILDTEDNNNEKIETKMTEEMADLADHLKTPLAVYEYLYNNVNVEYYTGSRKGAIGTYEQNGGNDVDCASLLIAMLRYLEYDAEYVTGKIGVTEKQLLELTGTDSVDDALNIIGIHFKQISKNSDYYYFTHTWVRTVINGESYDLDISLKKYKQVLSLNDATEYVNKNYSADELLEITNISTYQNRFEDKDIADPNSEFSFSGRAIVQKPIKELPTKTYFIQENESEILSNICDSKLISRDKVTFTISGESKTYYSSDLYVDDLTIGYTFNPADLENFEWYELDLPTNSVYGLVNGYWMTGVRLDTSPAIYINNKIDYIWEEATTVVDSNDIKITVFSSGSTFDFNKTIDCGSINAFEFNFQNISAQEIMTSQANMPSEDDIGRIDSSRYRDSDCLKNYLTLMGAMYFSECDIQNKILSSSLNVHQEKFLSFGVFSYNADIKDYGLGYGETFEDTGSLEVDILDNTYIQKSYTGNKDDERSFHFMSGLAYSYQESEILEQFTEESSVSTVSVLETAMDMDIPILSINSQNIDRIDTLGLYNEDKAIIREAVKSGAYVTVPEKNIKINSWTGTGYIIQNNDTGDLSFKITGAINGASTVNKATQDALRKYALICGSVAFVDTVSALYSSVMIMSNAAMSLIYASNAFGAIGGVVAFGAGIAIMNAAIKSYQAAVENCFLVLEGNPEAAMELLIDTELTLIVDVLGELGGITASAIKNKIAKDYIESSFPEELVVELYKTFECSEETLAKFIKTTKNAGVGSECLMKMLKDSGCIDNYPKKVLKQLGKLDKEAQCAIVEGIGKCSKDLPDILKKLDKDGLGRFFNAVSKDADEVFEQLAKTADIEKATDCIVKYGDSASIAIGKHGDKAVELLDMIPSKQCADVLSNASEKIVDTISKLDKTAAEKFINVVAKNDKALIESINNCSFVDDAVKMIAKFEDNGVDIFNKYKDKLVIGLSKALDSSSSNAITFAECKNGEVYVAGSCNYRYNPTITAPDGYIVESQSKEYYFKKYNSLLTDEFISNMNVSDSVKKELKNLSDAIEDTKAEAQKLYSDVEEYHFTQYGADEYTLAPGHSVSNCGEIWSAREAILNGAKFDELSLSTYWNSKSGSKSLGEFMEKCENCQFTFGGEE